ncbi:MAG: thioredoxin domain-containing protein [Chloroflexota bacterium]
MKRAFALLSLIVFLSSAASLLAQDATPEATAQADTHLSQSVSEIFAGLPQLRTEDGGFVVGQPDAPITIIEFADYACPHCQAYRPVIDQVITDYVATGQAKFELRIFPTAGGQLTYFAGLVVECANHQALGSFWQAYELLYGYATSGEYDETLGESLAAEYDINYEKLLRCVEYAQQVETDIAFGQQLGVTGTPAVMVRIGNAAPHFITFEGSVYNSGGVPFAVLAAVIEAANPEPEVI